MGENVNSPFMDYCLFVETKTNTLYFTSKRKKYLKSEFKNMDEILKTFNAYENGMSRIYQTTLTPNQ